MSDTPSGPAIYDAIARVMADVDHVGKDGRNSSQNFNFRGIDDVLNAVGPIFRRHKIVVLPRVISADYQTMKTERGRDMSTVRLQVEYAFATVDGSSCAATVAAEAFDFGDKATAKAMSVAFRTALIQVLALPTNAPDPDEFSYDISATATDPRAALWEAKNQMLATWQSNGRGDGNALREAFAEANGKPVDAATLAEVTAFTASITSAREMAGAR